VPTDGTALDVLDAGGGVKPPIPYFGGKITLGPTIARLLPEHRHYVEPYAGSLAVLLAKKPSSQETVNDLDEKLVTFWRVLRERPDELIRACALTPHSRLEYDKSVPLDAVDELEVARQIWIKLTQGRSGRLKRTGWRHYVDPAGTSMGMPGYLEAYVDRMAPAVERLHRVSLECRPALDLIERYGQCPEVLLYVDPPYLGSTRGDDNAYRIEMRDDKAHRDLAAALRAARAAVVLSGYASELYDLELYPDWDRHTMASGTGQGVGWGNRTEVLWSNRPIGHQRSLFDDLAEGGAAA
jgi:DNA adenine methylase